MDNGKESICGLTTQECKSARPLYSLTPHERGQKAFHAGCSEEENPYDDPKAAYLWFGGWLEEADKTRNKETTSE